KGFKRYVTVFCLSLFYFVLLVKPQYDNVTQFYINAMNIFQLKKTLFLLVIITVFFAGCKKSDSQRNTQLSGLVEKGPFIRGSRVSVAELDNNLNPTGRIFETDIQNDEGFFELKGVELKS